jgi:hypothetical protein
MRVVDQCSCFLIKKKNNYYIKQKKMKKGRKNLLEKVFISEQEKVKMERKARRQADIEFGVTPYKTKVHKNKKAYSRKAKHKVSFFD